MMDATREVVRRLMAAPEVTSFEEASRLIGDLGLVWKVNQEMENGGRFAFAVISYEKATKDTWLVIWMERCTSPRHMHGTGGAYGEFNRVLAGHMTDMKPGVAGSGLMYTLSRGDMDVHDSDTVHAPRTDGICLVLTHHPAGSILVAA